VSPLLRALWLALALALSTLACAASEPEAGPLWVDASELRFDLAHPEQRVEIHNRSGLGRPVGDFHLGGEDWDTLRFVEDTLPRTIPAHGSIEIELAISTAAYRVEPGVYRSGTASLSFRSTAHDYEVPIRFEPPEATRPHPGVSLTLLAMWAGLLVFGATLARRRSRSPAAIDPPRLAWVAASLAALLTAAATLPLGYGWCRGRLGERVGPRELDQCRACLGGSPLEAFASSPSLIWLFVALALVAATSAALRANSPRTAAPALALAGVRLLGFALLIAALGFGLAPADGSITGFILPQAELARLGQIALPRWGAVAQPVGFALALLLLASLPGSPHSEDQPSPIEQLLPRAERILWSALIATFYLGGPAVPWLSLRSIPLLPHAAQLALELLSLAAKTALLTWAATALHEPERRTIHWLVPLALAHLVAILLWV